MKSPTRLLAELIITGLEQMSLPATDPIKRDEMVQWIDGLLKIWIHERGYRSREDT